MEEGKRKTRRGGERQLVYLLQFEGDHGEGSEDTFCGPCDGDDPLWTGTLRDVDTSAALLARGGGEEREEGVEEGVRRGGEGIGGERRGREGR